MGKLKEEDQKILDGISLLLVEDDDLIRQVLEKYLSQYIPHIISAEDGEKGLELFTSQKIDIVLSDIRMPGLTGFEMAEAIKEIDPFVKIVISTAYDDRDFFLKAIELGVNEYIMKPAEREVILNAILKCARITELEKRVTSMGEQQELILRSTTEGVFGLDLEGRHTFVNEAAARMLGYEVGELLLQPSHTLWHHTRESGESFSELDCPIYHVLREGKSVCKDEDVFWRKDGSSFYVNYAASPIFQEDKVCGAVVTFSDVTQRVANKKRLKLLSLVVDQSINMVTVTDMEGSIEYVNESFCRITGYSDEEVIGQNPRILKSDKNDPSTYTQMWEKISHGKPWQGEVINKSKNGELYWAELMIFPLMNEQGQTMHYVAISNDVTERKYFEEKLKNINLKLEERVQEEIAKNREKDTIMFEQAKHAALGEVIKDIAHHWRQPLTAIGMLIHNIKDSYEYGEITAEYLNDIVEKTNFQLQNLSRTIDNFRTFFKPADNPIEIDIRSKLDDILFMLSGQLNNLFINYTLKGEETLNVVCLPNEFNQVIVNVLKNAMDSISKKRELEGSRFKGKIDIVLKEEGKEAVILVADNGMGIEEKDRDSIFDPSFSTKQQSSGAGLGLYMCKMILEQHMQGSITFNPRESGVEFVIRIPESV